MSTVLSVAASTSQLPSVLTIKDSDRSLVRGNAVSLFNQSITGRISFARNCPTFRSDTPVTLSADPAAIRALLRRGRQQGLYRDFLSEAIKLQDGHSSDVLQLLSLRAQLAALSGEPIELSSDPNSAPIDFPALIQGTAGAADLVCVVCSKIFTDPDKFTKHKGRAHPVIRVPCPNGCIIDGAIATFTNQTSANDHSVTVCALKQITEDQIDWFYCEFCGLAKDTFTKIKRHARGCESNPDRVVYACPRNCGAPPLTRAEGLETHLKTCNGPKVYKYLCEKCGWGTNWKHDFKKHDEQCDGERPKKGKKSK